MTKIKRLRLNEKIILKGRWSSSFEKMFDENGKFSEKVVSGDLELTEDHISLKLNGKIDNSTKNSDKEFNRIYGYSSNGLFIILENCFVENSSFSVPGYEMESYSANKGYIIELNSNKNMIKNEILATKVKFGINYLNDWLNLELPSASFDETNGYTITYHNDFFQNNRYDILDGKYYISLRRNIKVNNNINKGSSIKFDPYVSISTKDYSAISVCEFIELSSWLLKLHDFLSQTYGKYEYFEFYFEDEINNFSIEKLENGNMKFNLPFYKGRYIFLQMPTAETNLDINALRLKDIKDEYGKIAQNWFKNQENLKYIINLYYQNAIPTMDIESIVVNKIKMLEAYYDNYMGNESENITDFDIKVENTKTIIKNCLEDFDIEIPVKEEIIIRLDKDGSRNISLREKLTVILDKIPNELKENILNLNPDWRNSDETISIFSERLKDTRNFYTHGANVNRHKKRLKTITEFIIADIILDIIIYYYVLNTLGIGKEKIIEYPFIRKKLKEIEFNLGK